MKYLKTNDEMINMINTPRQENYWRAYLTLFSEQIIDYGNKHEWNSADGALKELGELGWRFPKEWHDLGRKYSDYKEHLSNKLTQIEDLVILEKNEVEYE
tara:strand:+ start:725 stop:1024 length:300 start_codon:yes stop_codon:yes gene_type:complete